MIVLYDYGTNLKGLPVPIQVLDDAGIDYSSIDSFENTYDGDDFFAVQQLSIELNESGNEFNILARNMCLSEDNPCSADNIDDDVDRALAKIDLLGVKWEKV